jgi:hypothetical protein
VRAAVRRFARPLADLIARDANEGDTRLSVTDFLCDGLGYDKYEDLTTEYRVKGEFADYGVQIADMLSTLTTTPDHQTGSDLARSQRMRSWPQRQVSDCFRQHEPILQAGGNGGVTRREGGYSLPGRGACIEHSFAYWTHGVGQDAMGAAASRAGGRYGRASARLGTA